MRALLFSLLAFTVVACGHAPPAQTANACEILEDRSSWWKALKRTERRWDISPGMTLAILNQESSLNGKARPPRKTVLFVFPGPRLSDAYGYPQAKNATWDWYKNKTGNRRARRDRFEDAADFVGWYAEMSEELSSIPKTDVRRQYLAYHEGHGGYNRATFRRKGWLMRVARDVADEAARYDRQIEGCRRRLNGSWLPFF